MDGRVVVLECEKIFFLANEQFPLALGSGATLGSRASKEGNVVELAGLNVPTGLGTEWSIIFSGGSLGSVGG